MDKTKRTRGEDTEILEVPDSVQLNMYHQKQRFNWDCGVSCVLMVLSAEKREDFLKHFTEVCNEEGFKKSTWTIDLCYLLRRFDIKHLYCTITLGVCPGYENQSFYSKILQKDEARINKRFEEAKDRGIDIKETSLTHNDLVKHLAIHGPIILLTNFHLLNCEDSKCKNFLTELRKLFYWDVKYNGHYILLCGYNLTKKKFLYRNPVYNDRICSVSFSAMDAARSSFGTDEDVILIFPSNPE